MFVARRRVEGLWSGRHVSLRYGAGQEFHDYRSYCPGDDTADIDWKLFGRTDRYFVRRQRQLTDLHAYLMLDGSASMDFAGLDGQARPIVDPDQPTKWRYGAELAAALAFLMVRQSDRAGLGLFDQRLKSHLPPGGTWAHLQSLCATLEASGPRPGGPGRWENGTALNILRGDTETQSQGTKRGHSTFQRQGNVERRPYSDSGVGTSLAEAHALMHRRGLVVLISDLLDEPAGLFDGLSRFRHDRFDVIVFQVLTPQELDLRGLEGLHLKMVDAETGQRAPTDIGTIRRDYADRMAGHLGQLRRGCAARGIDYNLLTTDQPVATALRRYLVRRSAMMR